MKENEPENFAKIAKIMLPKDYLAYRLSGSFCTEYSDASGMLLLDVELSLIHIYVTLKDLVDAYEGYQDSVEGMYYI